MSKLVKLTCFLIYIVDATGQIVLAVNKILFGFGDKSNAKGDKPVFQEPKLFIQLFKKL